MISKEDYAVIAAILRLCGKASPGEQRRQIISSLANMFARKNKRFDTEKFLDAAGLPK